LRAGAAFAGRHAVVVGGNPALAALEEDLLNAAAVETLIHGGEVFVVEDSILPARSPAAAMFRYTLGGGQEI
jgi:hypothetical protein